MSVLDLLTGAGLVSIGVLATALADRVRAIRTVRYLDERAPTRTARAIDAVATPTAQTPARKTPASKHAPEPVDRDRADVVQALIAAGYARAVATAAANECTSPERTNLSTWTKAALRRCMQGAA